jgi:hypothetical protein
MDGESGKTSHNEEHKNQRRRRKRRPRKRRIEPVWGVILGATRLDWLLRKRLIRGWLSHKMCCFDDECFDDAFQRAYFCSSSMVF